jgi:hypothetical protein
MNAISVWNFEKSSPATSGGPTVGQDAQLPVPALSAFIERKVPGGADFIPRENAAGLARDVCEFQRKSSRVNRLYANIVPATHCIPSKSLCLQARPSGDMSPKTPKISNARRSHDPSIFSFSRVHRFILAGLGRARSGAFAHAHAVRFDF